jgi:hypothetical protein
VNHGKGRTNEARWQRHKERATHLLGLTSPIASWVTGREAKMLSGPDTCHHAPRWRAREARGGTKNGVYFNIKYFCVNGASCHSVLNWQPAEEVLPREFQEPNAPHEQGAHPELRVYTRRTRDTIVSSPEPGSQKVSNPEIEFISSVFKQATAHCTPHPNNSETMSATRYDTSTMSWSPC